MAKLSGNNKIKELDKKQNIGRPAKSIVHKISTAKTLMISAKANSSQYEI